MHLSYWKIDRDAGKRDSSKATVSVWSSLAGNEVKSAVFEPPFLVVQPNAVEETLTEPGWAVEPDPTPWVRNAHGSNREAGRRSVGHPLPRDLNPEAKYEMHCPL